MTDTATARWGWPLLQPGQAQKEMTHNEALASADLVLHASAVSAGDDTPPTSPAEGDCWLVGGAPTGAWAGHAGQLAGWTSGGWRFAAPRNGMLLWVAADGAFARYADDDWRFGDWPVGTLTVAGNQVVGARQPAIANPTGGSVTDAESRAALVAILGALRAHGLIET